MNSNQKKQKIRTTLLIVNCIVLNFTTETWFFLIEKNLSLVGYGVISVAISMA